MWRLKALAMAKCSKGMGMCVTAHGGQAAGKMTYRVWISAFEKRPPSVG